MEHVHIVSVQSMFFYFILFDIAEFIFMFHRLENQCCTNCSWSGPKSNIFYSPDTPPQFTPVLLSCFCPCLCFCWISPCSSLSFGFLVLFCFCFCPVIQFESTRSSSPTECCRFSPWSRKVVVPPSLLPPASCLLCAPSNTLFRNSSPVLVCLTASNLHNKSLLKCMPT